MDNITIRNNYMKFTPDSGNMESQATMISYFNGFVKVYNNVVFTCPNHPGGGGFYLGIEEAAGGSQIYIWNNTIKAQNTSLYAPGITNVSSNSIKAIKNNISIGNDSGGGGIAIVLPNERVSKPSVIDYNILDFQIFSKTSVNNYG